MGIVGYLLFVTLFVVGVSSLTAAFVLMRRQAGHEAHPWSHRTTGALAVAALAWTVAAGSYLLFAPLGTSSSSSMTASDGGTVILDSTTSNETLVDREGTGVLVVVLIPIGLALVAALARRRWAMPTRIGAGVTLTVLCVLGMLSIGVFYLPAAILLLVAGLKTNRQPQADGAGTTPGRVRSG